MLDILQIHLRRHVPERHQRENHEIDEGYYWQRSRRADWAELQTAVERVDGPLWINGAKTYHGINDQVAESLLEQLNRSLYLICPDDTRIIVSVDDAGFGNLRRRVRVDFGLSGHRYRLIVTDPFIEERYLHLVGEHRIDGAVICVSLAEAYNGFAHKLAAAIITPQRARR